MKIPHYYKKKLSNFFNKLQKKIKFIKNKSLEFKVKLRNLEILWKPKKILKN